MSYNDTDRFTFRGRSHGYVNKNTPLSLSWSVYNDAISQNYTFEEASTTALWGSWITAIDWQRVADTYRLSPGVLPISWLVDPVTELLPTFTELDETEANFLTYYSWPTHDETDERVQWSRLPVNDKVWNADVWMRGGFIQEATGWKPSPLQRSVDIPVLAKASGLRGPDLHGVR